MGDLTIHEAAKRGDLNRVCEIVASDPDAVNADDQHEWRPIFHAGLHRQFEVVKYLIDQGADLSAHDGYVMHYSGEVPNDKRVVALLAQYGGLDAHVRPPTDEYREFIAAVFLANEARVSAMLGTRRRGSA